MADAHPGEPLDDILARAAVGIAQVEASGHYRMVNDAYCAMLGRARDELLQGKVHDFTHVDDLPTSLDGLIQVLESGAPQVIDQRQLRADGATVWTANNVSRVRDPSGAPDYLLLIASDITARKEAEHALTQSRADLRLLLDSAAGGLYCMDRRGATTLVNAAFLRMLGFAREEDALGRDLHGEIHHSRPDRTPYPREECPIYKAAHSGTPVHVVDELFFRRDGSSFPVEYWVRPIVRDGEIQGAICTFVDLTERKAAEGRQQVMNQELAHRVKNTLAMVQAIVSQTLRNTPDRDEAIQAINQRLVALGNAHTALTRTRWGTASIMDVVEGALAVHRAQNRRIDVHGPQLDLGAKAALAVGMGLHELCTNAAKYGALSRDGGAVRIEWSVTGGAADATFHLQWRETGGPPVTPPTRKGFGTRLIADAIGADLDGTATLRYEPAGVVWTLEAPLTSVKK